MTLRNAGLLARLAVTTVLMFLVLRTVDFHLIVAKFLHINPAFLAGAIVLIAMQAILVMAWRWGVVLAAIGHAVSRRKLLLFVTIAIFFNQTLPSSHGGDAMRIWLLRQSGPSLSVAAGSVLIERGFGFLVLVVLALIGSVALLSDAGDRDPLWLVISLSTSVLIGVAGLTALLRLGARKPALGRLHDTFAAFHRTMATLGRDRQRFAKFVLLTLLGQLLIFLAVLSVAQALHVSIGLLDVVAVMPAVILVASLPISIGGWGVREGAMVVGLGLVGVQGTEAIAVSVVYGLLLLFLGLLCAPVWLTFRVIDRSEPHAPKRG